MGVGLVEIDLAESRDARGDFDPARQKAGVCSGCGIFYNVCPEPGAITVYRRLTQGSEVRDAATV